nr:Na+/H+ antiporter NhaC family protein [Phocaeicola plebeius]
MCTRYWFSNKIGFKRIKMTQKMKIPSPLVSLLPVAVLVILLFFTIRLFGADALGGGSQICLLLTTALCAALGMSRYGVSWKDIEHAIINNIAGVSSALIILLIIGALSAAWMLGGVVPTLIYYGVQIIHPKFFLVSCCVICAVVSVMTGSSWTTIATIGIALMGIGKAQGFEEGWIAGAIISGAYFGDKVSPLSDTTILASSVTDTPLFTHIRYMMYTTVPSVVISLVIFTVAGFSHEASDSSQIAVFTTGLAERFHITFWVLLVPVVTGILIARKVSSIITLFVSTALAVICMLVFQTDVLREVSGDGVNGGEALYKGVLLALSGSTSLQTSTPVLTELIATRGMGGMMDTVWLILCAMCLGGAMTACGMLGSITRMFVRFTHKLASTVAATVASGLFLNLATADQYISIILTGNMFKDIYKKNGYESRLLSRTTEDAVTVTSPLIPWNTCGMTQATILNVPTLVYLPYSFFNLLSPLMSIFVACIGFKIVRSVKKD